jgi:glycosyltransferase family protein
MPLWESLKNKLAYEVQKINQRQNRKAAQQSSAWQNTASIDETLEQLLASDCSVCRFGDGEYKVMAGGKNGFQQSDPVLAARLRQVLRSDAADLLVCIPNIRGDRNLRTGQARAFWDDFAEEYGKSFTKMLDPQKKYYNAHVTRLYMDYQNCGKSSAWFRSLKKVWAGKDLLIVEGVNTRLGVGNDLFSEAGRIRRILCPGKSAFSHYETILQTVKTLWNGELILIALGQTATVLAYDLHLAGIRALDIGHVDIEYEWFLAGTTEKTAVAGKFVKEVEDQLLSQELPYYQSQIAAKVGV